MTADTTIKDKFIFVHGCYTNHQGNENDDAVFVKRYRVKPDGTRIPEMMMHENVIRKYWITKKAYQNHDGKLEYEYLNRLTEHKSNQRKLVRNIQQKLGLMPSKKTSLRQVCNSPFVYGCDKDIVCVVADNYKKHFSDVEPIDLEVGCMDTETNVVDRSNDLIIMSFFHGNKAVVAIDRNWITDSRETPESYRDFINEVVPEIQEMEIDLEVVFMPTPAECVIHVINRAHEWKPDIIGFWNINFDMPLLIRTLEAEGHDPADIFSDPAVPKHYRYFKYKEGQTTKLTDSGKFMPLTPSQQWHTLFTPASFYFIDPSSMYRCLRRQKAEPSYALDFLTKKICGAGKLKPDLPLLKNVPENSLKWHYIMQKHYPKWYAAYALVDVIQPVRMDRKTHDISKKLATLSMGSHFKDFNSNPRRLCDQLDGFFLENGAVVGTTGAEMESPLDKLIPVSKDWIVTLEAPLIEDQGLILLAGNRAVKRSKLSIHCADLDIVSTYPILGMIFNIARETALFETCKIEGLGYFEHREFCVNLTGGIANAVLLAEEVLGLKGFDDLLDDFENAHGLANSFDRQQTEWIEAKMKKRQQARAAAKRSKAIA